MRWSAIEEAVIASRKNMCLRAHNVAGNFSDDQPKNQDRTPERNLAERINHIDSRTLQRPQRVLCQSLDRPTDDEASALALRIAEIMPLLGVQPRMLRQSETAWISQMGQMEDEGETRHQQWRCRAVPRAADASTFSPSVNPCLLGSKLAGL
ncbi:hypothetical protein AbraIFM66950_008444 [Aspergillus brasiliensis]|nr:hypothetical protein AbraIFM66950_008444 [Aspergillus brasiliensis]